ncbi:MAG: hypothetical protein AAF511_11010 [Pseudomonadota bacterium]
MSQFNKAFLQIGRGALAERADELVTQVTAAAIRTGKKGKVSVEITLDPTGDGGFKVSGSVKANAPEVQFAESFFWQGEDGKLQRTPPKEASQQLLKPVEEA